MTQINSKQEENIIITTEDKSIQFDENSLTMPSNLSLEKKDEKNVVLKQIEKTGAATIKELENLVQMHTEISTFKEQKPKQKKDDNDEKIKVSLVFSNRHDKPFYLSGNISELHSYNGRMRMDLLISRIKLSQFCRYCAKSNFHRINRNNLILLRHAKLTNYMSGKKPIEFMLFESGEENSKGKKSYMELDYYTIKNMTDKEPCIEFEFMSI